MIPRNLEVAIGMKLKVHSYRFAEEILQHPKHEGVWKEASRHTAEVKRRFATLLKTRTRAGDEALAYLLTVYMGEHPGEELVCEAINRGKRMLPLIDSYARCNPRIGVEPLPKFVRGSGVLPREARQGIEKGKRCKHSD